VNATRVMAASYGGAPTFRVARGGAMDRVQMSTAGRGWLQPRAVALVVTAEIGQLAAAYMCCTRCPALHSARGLPAVSRAVVARRPGRRRTSLADLLLAYAIIRARGGSTGPAGQRRCRVQRASMAANGI
jgi:hypothetical protein